MRVSTSQVFLQSSKYMTQNESSLNEQVAYLSSGKKVLSAKDDAVSYGTLVGYKDELAGIERYKRNIVQGKNRNTLVESSFSTAQRVLNNVKQTFIQANNGAMSDDDRESLSDLLRQNLEEILDIANTKDETGGYVFSGFQIDKQPFELQPDNSVVYQGDNGVRQLKIAKNVEIPLNQPGDEAFEKVPNAIGDFSPIYNTNESGVSVSRAIIVDRGAHDTVTNPPDYNFNFSALGNLTVRDGGGTIVYPATPYAPGQIIAFNGIEVQLSGNPVPGDDFDITPQENISIFETIKSAIEWVDVKGTAKNTQEHSVSYGHILSQLSASLNHVSTRQGEAGINLQLLESQSIYHVDNELLLEQGRSSIEDLDFAKAVTQFEQSKVALQAAQQTYSKLQGLSLFNYI